MACFVIVAGGWRGGWTMSPFARRLRALGHEVFTPTLTGLGERVHLAHAGVNLDTHIEDVCNVLRFEDLHEVVLCGHSYAGMVITAVADRLPERIASLVYLDAFVPEDGQSWWDLAGDYFRQVAIDGSAQDGLGVVPPPGKDPRRVPHPLAAFRQRVGLTGAWQRVPDKVYVHATGWAATPFTALRERLGRDAAWAVHDLPVEHDVVGQAPEDLLRILLARPVTAMR